LITTGEVMCQYGATELTDEDGDVESYAYLTSAVPAKAS
jgi:hypothetical protein